MNHRHVRDNLLVALSAIIVLAGTKANAQVAYTVVDIGSLGYGIYRVSAINNAGQVTGVANNSTGRWRAFLWTPVGTDGVPVNPQMKELAAPTWNDPNCFSYDLNNQGAVSGWVSNVNMVACVWQAGGALSAVGKSSEQSVAYSLNDAGQAVGYQRTSKGSKVTDTATLWKNGAAYSLGSLSGYPHSVARAINAPGQVIGRASTQVSGPGVSFLWIPNTPNGTKGSMVALSDFFPTALNDATVIVGNHSVAADIPGAAVPGPYLRAVRWQNGTITDLERPAGFYESTANALNNQPAPLIVGSAIVYDMDWNATIHAMLWSGGTVTDLNDAITPLSGWVLTEAVGVNDSGWILCSGTKDGVQAGAVLIPNAP